MVDALLTEPLLLLKAEEVLATKNQFYDRFNVALVVAIEIV